MEGSQALAEPERAAASGSACVSIFRRAGIRSGAENRILDRASVFVWDGDIYGHRFCAVDDTGGGVGVNLGEGAQKQAGDIGENGGTVRGDTVLGQEFVKVLRE